jgi:hypothetical protein
MEATEINVDFITVDIVYSLREFLFLDAREGTEK